MDKDCFLQGTILEASNLGNNLSGHCLAWATPGPGRALIFLVLGADPGVGLVRHFGQRQQVIPTETFGRGPLFAVLVEAAEGGVVTNARFRFVSPDCGLDKAEPDLVYGFGFVLHDAIRRR